MPNTEYPRVADNPTREDAIACANQLLELMTDFPFKGPEHLSVWLSLVLTLAGRPAIKGCCPLFAFDASTPGSGKTLAASIAHVIVYGSEAPRKTYPSEDAEMRKTITALAREAINCCLFDNVATTLGCASLDSALTATTWTDRVLGTNDTTGELPLFIVLVATGNNLTFGADSLRRVVYCRLEPSCEHPEERIDFHIPDLIGHVRQERARLLVAAVTVLRAYTVAGRPLSDLTPCSFPEWSDLIRQAIVWLVLPDPHSTHNAMKEADHGTSEFEQWYCALKEADFLGRGITTAELELKLREPTIDDRDKYPSLREIAAEHGVGKPLSASFGYALRKLKGRVRDGQRLQSEPTHAGIQRWFFEPIA